MTKPRTSREVYLDVLYRDIDKILDRVEILPRIFRIG